MKVGPIMSEQRSEQNPCLEDDVSINAARNDNAPVCGLTLRDSPVRRLRRENHLLRLQLLKLREQQRSLLSQVVAAGFSLKSGVASQAASSGAAQGLQHVTTNAPADAGDKGPAARSSPFSEEEAAAVRARILQRQEERQSRTTSARALLPGVGLSERKLDEALLDQHQQRSASGNTDLGASGASALSTLATPAVDVILKTPAADARGVSQGLATELLQDAKAAVEDDMSAQAMLLRFQKRKAQRRLRLEQMLGSSYESGGVDDGGAETTPFGDVPRRNAGVHEGGTMSGASSNSNSSLVGDGTAPGSEAPPDETGVSGTSTAAAIGHRSARQGESIPAAVPPPAGPTQNPNQIGRVVSDAVRNNSWYLCKVLEAALLDTIQTRHVTDDHVPARTTTTASLMPHASSTQWLNSSHGGAADGAVVTGARLSPLAPTPPFGDSRSTGGGGEDSGTATLKTLQNPPSASVTPTSSTTPQFLYQLGVSDTALRRAIEESLVLPYRCVHDAPQRLTSQQAAEEAVPPFEAENKDSELRRCFAGHARRHSTERSNFDDDNTSNSPAPAGADDEVLDPFARLLLARLSAELLSNDGKGDKKHKGSRGSGKQCDDVPQGSSYGPGEGGGSSFGVALGKGAPKSIPSATKVNAAFVMAAAGGEGRVHIPKKHFSRLDEVQVEMHAPVIFNQIRGFLRLDIDRFRRSFLHTGGRGEVADAARSSSATEGGQQLCSPSSQQQQQRRGRIGAAAAAGVTGTVEATAWRISVSPGKSGTTLLYFGDYVMKTVRPSEMEFFTRKFLPAYVRYCERNPHTLLPRFYALVTVRWWKAGMAQHFVLMHNVFATPYYIHRIYDVKGSTVNRTALQPGKPPPRTAFGALLLKDNDLPPQLIICGAYQRAILLAQFRSDVGFLRQLSVVDYSCMIGVRSRLFSREEGPSKTIVLQRHQHQDNDEPYVDPLGGGEVPRPLARHQRAPSEVTNVTSVASDAGAQTVTVAINGAGPGAASSGGQPASNDDVYVCIHGCDGGLLSLPIYAPGDDTTAREDVYYLGIIDVLQTYNSAKKLESFAKGFVNDRQAISVIPPDGYSERLYKVLERITV
jgi:hypothetical protein